jgi:hypothetical protein
MCCHSLVGVLRSGKTGGLFIATATQIGPVLEHRRIGWNRQKGFLDQAKYDSLTRPQDVGAAMVWRQGQSYSQDLRARVLAAVDGGMTARSAASVFRVSVSYIYKALIRRRRTGEVSASTRRGHRPRKLTPEQEPALATHIAAHPDITLAVDRLGLSFKKRHSAPPSRIGQTLPLGAGSGRPRSPSSMPTSSCSSTRPVPAPR